MTILVFDLKGYRIAEGLSQEDVAKRLGTDQSYISYLERNKTHTKLSTISMIAKKLDVIPSTFIREVDEDEMASFEDIRKCRVMSLDAWVEKTIREVEQKERKEIEGDLR